MEQVREDLWRTTPPPQTAANCSFLLRRPLGNILFYNGLQEDDLDALARLGGVKHHVLSHRHEVRQGPWRRVKERFQSKLWCDRVEAAAIGEHAEIDVVFETEGARPGDVVRASESLGEGEALYAPGHTLGGTNFVYRSREGQTYLFCGDTLVPVNRRWLATIVADDGGDFGVLADTLAAMRELKPSLILSSTFVGELIVEIEPDHWPSVIETNIARLRGP